MIRSRHSAYLLAFAIMALIFGWPAWKFWTTILLALVTWHWARWMLRRIGWLRRRAPRKRASIPEWIEAISFARIALSFGGVTSKREHIPKGLLARYRLRSRKPGPSDDVPF